MRRSPLVGIYSRPSDDHLNRVIQELDRRNLPFVRFDTADFPQQIQLIARLAIDQECWQDDFVYSGTHYRLEDFRLVTPDGEYVFLELNSSGQWGWIENHTRLPLTETLVNLLAAGKIET